MYKDDVIKILQEKKEARVQIFIEFILIYIKFLIVMKNDKYRKQLYLKIKEYFLYDDNEILVLKEIKKLFGDIEEIEEIDIMLDDFDKIFNNNWEYYQSILNDYHCWVDSYFDINHILNNYYKDDYQDFYRLNFPNNKSLSFNENYKSNCLEKLKLLALNCKNEK